MPLLLLLFALFVPRVVIVLLWLFSTWFTGSIHWVLGVLGFVFLPYTLLWYTAVQHWYGGEWGVLQLVILVIAVLADLGLPGSTRYRRSENL